MSAIASKIHSSKHLMRRLSFLNHRPFSTSGETRAQKLERIADELLSLTQLERHDYAILLRHKLGLNRYGPSVSGGIGSSGAGAGAGAPSGTETAKPAAEKTSFDVKLEKFDADAKVKVIKEVRAFSPGLTMKAAKDLIDKAPCVVKKGATKEEADDIVKKLMAAGATAALE